MSEVQSRPAAPRGRGSARGGRGGFSARGGRGGRGHGSNSDKAEVVATDPIEGSSEVTQLKKKYGNKVGTLKEIYPNWTDEDIVFALQETNGDLELAVERISDGSISQWGEVSKPKKASKAKDVTHTAPHDSSTQSRGSRGGRGGVEGGRGSRGRGVDRGRGARGRGASVAPASNARKETTETTAATTDTWDVIPAEDAAEWGEATKTADDSWGTAATSAAAATADTAAKAASSIIPDGVKKSWASMFAPAPVPKKAPEHVEKPVEAILPKETTEPEPAVQEIELPAPEEVESKAPEVESIPEPETIITPSADELTETNLEQVPDVSQPAPTATAASTAASSWDPRATPGVSTPLSAAVPLVATQSRPPTSGFQASALKATGTSGRSASYQRRVLDQEEAVRMPGNREVDRAAVQFGAFSLNGTSEEDVDGDREEPETRAQPPQHSPVAHPRAALPPAPQQPSTAPETLPTPKQATSHPPGLPSPQAIPSAQTATQQPPQGNGQFGQYGRYGQTGTPEQASLPQKPYDAFSHQAPSAQGSFDGYPNQTSQPPGQSGAFSSAPNDFSSYYASDPQQRSAYNSYYQQQYGQQQGTHGQQEGGAPPQRSFSGYNGPQAEGGGQFPSGSTQQTQSRYGAAGEGQNSGHTTPNPATQSQQQQVASQGQPQPGHPQHSGYPYGQPYYTSPYYASYMNQYQYGGNYGAGPYGGAKSGAHGQPYQGYGMSPGAPYDQHSPSPATGGFAGSSLHGRDSALGGGLGDYGRTGSAQASQAPQGLGSSGSFGMHDTFGRGSSYPGQNQQQYNNQQGSQPAGGDDLKPFGDKATTGPSPSLSQPGRPGSATNTTLPPPQSQQSGYGGYPSQGHMQQGHGAHGNQTGNQYGTLGGGGGQSSQYGGYQSFGGGYQGYGANTQQRGGWGGNYGH